MASSSKGSDALVSGMKNMKISDEAQKRNYINLFEEEDFVDDVKALPDFTLNEYNNIVKHSRLNLSNVQKKQLDKNSKKKSVFTFLVFLKGLKPNQFPSLRSLVKAFEEDGIKRPDISQELRRYLPAGTTGPRLERATKVKDIGLLLKKDLETELSINRPDGHDWRLIAEQLGIDNRKIKLWDQREDAPMAMVFDAWEPNKGSTVGALYDILVDNGMAQTADIL